jgi:hypothetical protein
MPVARLATALALLVAASPSANLDDTNPISAVCPIVYRLDESPSAHGYHYVFFGNAFFINEQGYLLTAAHVLETFRDGGQPFILVNRPNSPPRLLQVTVIATDPAHDVAILRATPNPFASNYQVAFLPLASDRVVPGQSVVALSLHPPRLQNAHTFDLPLEARSAGEVLSYESTQLDKSAPATDIFLLSHPVTRGQSGSPVMALDTHATPSGVVGLIEGRWLRTSALALTASAHLSATGSSAAVIPGAAIPISHAITLLQQKSIPFHAAPGSSPPTHP